MGNHNSKPIEEEDATEIGEDDEEIDNADESKLSSQERWVIEQEKKKKKEKIARLRKKGIGNYRTKIVKLHSFKYDVYLSYDLGADSQGRLIKSRMKRMKFILNKSCKVNTLDYDDATTKYIDILACEKRIAQALSDSCAFVVVMTKNYVRIVNETFSRLSPALQSSYLLYFQEEEVGSDNNKALLQASITTQLLDECARVASSSNTVAIEFLLMAVVRGPVDMVPIMLEDDIYSAEANPRYIDLFNAIFKMRLQLECFDFEIVEDEVDKMLMLLNRLLSQRSAMISSKTAGYNLICGACAAITDRLNESMVSKSANANAKDLTVNLIYNMKNIDFAAILSMNCEMAYRFFIHKYKAFDNENSKSLETPESITFIMKKYAKFVVFLFTFFKKVQNIESFISAFDSNISGKDLYNLNSDIYSDRAGTFKVDYSDYEVKSAHTRMHDKSVITTASAFKKGEIDEDPNLKDPDFSRDVVDVDNFSDMFQLVESPWKLVKMLEQRRFIAVLIRHNIFTEMELNKFYALLVDDIKLNTKRSVKNDHIIRDKDIATANAGGLSKSEAEYDAIYGAGLDKVTSKEKSLNVKLDVGSLGKGGRGVEGDRALVVPDPKSPPRLQGVDHTSLMVIGDFKSQMKIYVESRNADKVKNSEIFNEGNLLIDNYFRFEFERDKLRNQQEGIKQDKELELAALKVKEDLKSRMELEQTRQFGNDFAFASIARPGSSSSSATANIKAAKIDKAGGGSNSSSNSKAFNALTSNEVMDSLVHFTPAFSINDVSFIFKKTLDEIISNVYICNTTNILPNDSNLVFDGEIYSFPGNRSSSSGRDSHHRSNDKDSDERVEFKLNSDDYNPSVYALRAQRAEGLLKIQLNFLESLRRMNAIDLSSVRAYPKYNEKASHFLSGVTLTVGSNVITSATNKISSDDNASMSSFKSSSSNIPDPFNNKPVLDTILQVGVMVGDQTIAKSTIEKVGIVSYYTTALMNSGVNLDFALIYSRACHVFNIVNFPNVNEQSLLTSDSGKITHVVSPKDFKFNYLMNQLIEYRTIVVILSNFILSHKCDMRFHADISRSTDKTATATANEDSSSSADKTEEEVLQGLKPLKFHAASAMRYLGFSHRVFSCIWNYNNVYSLRLQSKVGGDSVVLTEGFYSYILFSLICINTILRNHNMFHYTNSIYTARSTNQTDIVLFSSINHLYFNNREAIGGGSRVAIAHAAEGTSFSQADVLHSRVMLLIKAAYFNDPAAMKAAKAAAKDVDAQEGEAGEEGSESPNAKASIFSYSSENDPRKNIGFLFCQSLVNTVRIFGVSLINDYIVSVDNSSNNVTKKNAVAAIESKSNIILHACQSMVYVSSGRRRPILKADAFDLGSDDCIFYRSSLASVNALEVLVGLLENINTNFYSKNSNNNGSISRSNNDNIKISSCSQSNPLDSVISVEAWSTLCIGSLFLDSLRPYALSDIDLATFSATLNKTKRQAFARLLNNGNRLDRPLVVDAQLRDGAGERIVYNACLVTVRTLRHLNSLYISKAVRVSKGVEKNSTSSTIDANCHLGRMETTNHYCKYVLWTLSRLASTNVSILKSDRSGYIYISDIMREDDIFPALFETLTLQQADRCLCEDNTIMTLITSILSNLVFNNETNKKLADNMFSASSNGVGSVLTHVCKCLNNNYRQINSININSCIELSNIALMLFKNLLYRLDEMPNVTSDFESLLSEERAASQPPLVKVGNKNDKNSAIGDYNSGGSKEEAKDKFVEALGDGDGDGGKEFASTLLRDSISSIIASKEILRDSRQSYSTIRSLHDSVSVILNIHDSIYNSSAVESKYQEVCNTFENYSDISKWLKAGVFEIAVFVVRTNLSLCQSKKIAKEGIRSTVVNALLFYAEVTVGGLFKTCHRLVNIGVCYQINSILELFYEDRFIFLLVCRVVYNLLLADCIQVTSTNNSTNDPLLNSNSNNVKNIVINSSSTAYSSNLFLKSHSKLVAAGIVDHMVKGLEFHYHHLFFSSSETTLLQVISSDNVFFNICKVIRELCRNVSNVKANISKSTGNNTRLDIDDDNVIAVEKFKNTRFGSYLICLKKNLLDVRLAKDNIAHHESAPAHADKRVFAYYDVKPIAKYNDDEINYFDPSVNLDIHRGGGSSDSVGLGRSKSPSNLSPSKVTFQDTTGSKEHSKKISSSISSNQNNDSNNKYNNNKERSSNGSGKGIPKADDGPQYAQVETAYPFINILTDISNTDDVNNLSFSSILRELYTIFQI